MTSQGSKKSKGRLLKEREFFFANNFWANWVRAKLRAQSRSSRWYASKYAYHDLIRSRSRGDLRSRDLKFKMYIIRCVLMRWTQWDHARCCSSFLCEVIGKNILVTRDDITWPHGWHIAKIASRDSGMVMTDVIHDRGCYYDEYLSKMSQLIFSPLTYNGEVKKLTWP